MLLNFLGGGSQKTFSFLDTQAHDYLLQIKLGVARLEVVSSVANNSVLKCFQIYTPVQN